MLDEANVGRFRDLLAELSQETQFIVITHNRNTVQAADFIYGVTMGRDSTSQIISLRLDEVSEEMLGTAGPRQLASEAPGMKKPPPIGRRFLHLLR